MSNVLKFPEGGSAAVARRHVGAAFLEQPVPHSHAVQFYEDDAFLVDTVGQFLAAGLEAGDRLVVIATPEHRAGFARYLEAFGGEDAARRGQLLLLDAAETLAQFMVDGAPDPQRFRDTLARALTTVRGREGADPASAVRAYGEMVDVLWRGGNPTAAIRLEELWNEAGKEHSFTLLCAYVMGSFLKESDAGPFMEVCRTHSHVIPTEAFAQLDDSHARLREIALLQQRAHSLASEIEHRKELEAALREALRERARAEEELRTSLERETEARKRAEESDAFKEVFLGMLGHDLKNPLNTVLTTARLMAIRGELPAASKKRLDRIISSGVRMQRMIGQILDVTRARLAGGIPLTRTERDVSSLVAKIVDEVQAATPDRRLELHGADQPCTASIDGDRLEQVVSNLIGNAVVHGDPELPIRVELSTTEDVVILGVVNAGKPIDPAFVPLLFDPFRRDKPHGQSDGLGLGLYISERIVTAHGGTIRVASSEETGTRFDVILPRR